MVWWSPYGLNFLRSGRIYRDPKTSLWGPNHASRETKRATAVKPREKFWGFSNENGMKNHIYECNTSTINYVLHFNSSLLEWVTSRAFFPSFQCFCSAAIAKLFVLSCQCRGGMKLKWNGGKLLKNFEWWLIKLWDRVIILNSVIELCLTLVGDHAALSIITFIHARKVEKYPFVSLLQQKCTNDRCVSLTTLSELEIFLILIPETTNYCSPAGGADRPACGVFPSLCKTLENVP